MNVNKVIQEMIYQQNGFITERKEYKNHLNEYIEFGGINQFFRSKSKNQYNEDLIFNCFGFQEVIIDEDYSYFKLFINPVIESKYLVSNEVFKFGKQPVERLNSSGDIYNFNTVEFRLSHDDMMWEYSGNSINCALTHFNKYFKEVTENIKNNPSFYEIDYDNIF